MIALRQLIKIIGSGWETLPTGHIEKLLSGAGSLLAIATVFGISSAALGTDPALLLIASMGASAVLLFALPHSPLSQPWPVMGGHIIAALIGITCYQQIPHMLVAAAVAVSGAIVVMYYLHCLHPPGGATALAAATSGAAHQLGYKFVLTPVLLNVVCMLAIAVIFNYFFPWRRYPAVLARSSMIPDDDAPTDEHAELGVSTEDLSFALRRMGSFIDVSAQDLTAIYALALQHARDSHLQPAAIRPGLYYSNGRYGENWAVRHIVDESGSADAEFDKVIYRVVAGNGRRSSGTCTRAEFARWARYQVTRNENSWNRVEHV
ncbi:MAG: HPP family protein [Gammaproteobacteria bacterium]|nr:HPP family protein [Gammaproteobacteria bacterium]